MSGWAFDSAFFNTDNALFHITAEGRRLSVIRLDECSLIEGGTGWVRIFHDHENDYSSVVLAENEEDLVEDLFQSFLADDPDDWTVEAEPEGEAEAVRLGIWDPKKHCIPVTQEG